MVSRIYKKQICGTIREYKIAHGVHGVFKDVLLCGESFVPMALPQEDDKGKHELLLFPSRVQGPSGDPNDVVCADCQLPDLQVGDWLVFDRMGAYTLSIASRTGRPIVRYVQGSGN
jgi:diaminopimelate decarboxylase